MADYTGKLPSNILKLLPYDFEYLKRFWGFEHELNQLRDSLLAMADLVEDAEEKLQLWIAAGQWLRNLKEVAYEAEDLLLDLAYEISRLHIQHKEVHKFSLISRAIGNVKKAKFRPKMAHKLKEVNQSLQIIQRDSPYLHLTSIQRNWQDDMSQNLRPTDSIIDHQIVGRKAEVAKIVNMITSFCYEKLTVVSIVGMDGLGKTVLAKLVCQKLMALTRNPFDVTIWVRFSDHYSNYSILRQMLQSSSSLMAGLTDEDAILQQLKKELVSKKFLLVLDDVWGPFSTEWDKLKTTLISQICTSNGNAVLVTTRHEELALRMETSPQHIHRLRLLSTDECWSIFKERAFRNVTPPVSSNLEAIGREIAKKSRGVPSVAKVLGGIIGFSSDEETWLKMRNDDGGSLTFTVIQSFRLLPSYLKSCFAFCSIFPKDFLIRKEELIWLWIAEGIVESYDMGDKCFDALLAISLFQDVERDDVGNVIICKMHDILRGFVLSGPHTIDLVQYRSEKLRTSVVRDILDRQIREIRWLRSLHLNGADMEVLQSSIEKMKHVKYLDVSMSETEELSESITKIYNLQTLNLSNSSIKEFPKFITKLYKLCSLNLSSSNIKELPRSINKLRNLRSLNLSSSKIKELPESITELYSLQTLNFFKCKELTKLPRKKINNMMSLKHIIFSYEHQMPFGLGKLNGLETLLIFVVGPDWGGSIQELECLNELRGDLKITRLEEVGDQEIDRANLRQKANIQGLSFQWSCGANDRSSRDEELLEGLQPHPNIKKIEIKYYMGENFPSWMFRMKSPRDGDSFAVLNNLVDLSLERCYNCVQLPRLGDLPHLKFLKMNHLGKVKGIDNEFYGIDSEGSSIGHLTLFPALKLLSISWMENLAEWSSPSDVNKVVFPCLENLSIQFCPKLTGFPMSNLSELVELDIRDCEELMLLTNKKQSLAFLTSLSIVGCPKVIDLQNWLLSDMSLKELSVRRCEWLTFIPKDLAKLSFLTSLEIYCCTKLRYFSEEILCKLTQLQNLSVGAFSEELDNFLYLNRIKDLPCLEELEIWGSDFFCREMGFLPDQLQHLTVLKSLKIIGFTTMEALPEWLVNLQSLRSLSLDYCRHLGYQSTVTVIQSLSNLTHLNINCCPILEESKPDLLQSLDTTKIKVELSHVSKVRVRLGY